MGSSLEFLPQVGFCLTYENPNNYDIIFYNLAIEVDMGMVLTLCRSMAQTGERVENMG